MQRSSDTLYRQWLMLRMLPRAPRKLDGATIERRLAHEGCHVGRRSIQRDLLALSSVFPLVCDDRSKPYGWSWARDASALEVPALDPHAALVLHLAAGLLAPLLPRATLELLHGHFQRAREVLNALGDGEVGAWPDKVHVVSRSQPLGAPDVLPELLLPVYRGLFEGRVLAVGYQRFGATRPRRFQVHPLGLVAREGVLYLVGRVSGTARPVQLALHRLTRAELTARLVRPPEGFDLSAYVASGAFGVLVADAESPLRATVRGPLVGILQEQPLAADQRLEPLEDGRWSLVADVPHTQKLRAWILGYGSMITVEAPASLRSDLAAEVYEMARHYGSPPPG